jgi:Leucine-rich repeat (LRR) protein
MSHLQFLSLAKNSIEDLNIGVFSWLISLIEVDVRMNKLQYIHKNSFVSFPNLKTLYFGYNSRLQIPTDQPFINSRSLLSLDIPGCNVSSVSVQTFATISALEWIDLMFNDLSSLDINILKALPKLSGLYLFGNLLHCDCQLQEVWRWCKDRNILTEY